MLHAHTQSLLHCVCFALQVRSHTFFFSNFLEKMASKTKKNFAQQFVAANMSIQPLTANPGGKGKSAWINFKDANFFEGEEFRVKFAPIPALDETMQIKPSTKMNLVCQIDPEKAEHAAFLEKAHDADNAVLEHFFAKKMQIWPDKAKYLNDKGALMGMYNPIVRDGSVGPEGQTYKPSFTLKLCNLSDNIERLIMKTVEKDGVKKEQVEDVVWKTIIARPGDVLNEKMPKFYLWLDTDKDGNDVVTQKVDVKGKDGKIVLNTDGTKVRRWVGPQDIKKGDVVRPVFKVQKCYLSQGFGVHLVAEALIIKRAPPKEVAEFDHVKVVEEPDPVLSAKASAMIESQAEVSEDAPDEIAFLDEEGDIPAPAVGKKRKNDVADTHESAPAADVAIGAGAGEVVEEDVKSPTKKRKSEAPKRSKALVDE